MREVIEIQRMRDNKLVVVILAIAILLPVLLILVQISRLSPGTEEWIVLMLSLLFMLGMGFIILNLRTEIKLQKSSIEYYQYPFRFKKGRIECSEIVEFYFGKQRGTHSLFKTSMHSGEKFYMKPGPVLIVKLSDGREYRFGINRPVLIKKFLAENWSEKEESHG